MQSTTLTAKQARGARESLGLSQGRVSVDTGVGRTYLSQFECGKLILGDNQQHALRDYYEAQGIAFEESPEDDPLLPGPNGSRIRDGFLMPDNFEPDHAEALLSEIVENSERANTLLTNIAPQGFFGPDESACRRDCREAVLLMARNWHLVETLQGRADMNWATQRHEDEPKTAGQVAKEDIVAVFDIGRSGGLSNRSGRIRTIVG